MTQVGGYGAELADRICAALPAWVEGCVARVLASAATSATATAPTTAAVSASARAAGVAAAEDVGGQIRALLEADIDEQPTTPLAILRACAVPYPTGVLRAAGVAPVPRDQVDEAMFPDDVYHLAPASFADFGPAVFESGIAWGAAKAFEHKQRHRVHE